MENENKELVPQKRSLFPLSPDDIIDNALQNLDEKQAAEVTRKVADEVVRIAVEKRKAEYRNSASQEEMTNLINNANLLDEQVGDYKINSTFETASGTTSVEIRKSKFTPVNLIVMGSGLTILIIFIVLLLLKG
jgi:hypothetical protein